MSDVTINYKGNAIATIDASGTKTLLTEGKYCEDDIEVVYVSPGGGGGGNVNVSQDANGYIVLDDDAPSGGGGNISEFSKQNTVTIANPTEENVWGSTQRLKFAHGLGAEPKLVILTSNAATDGTVKGINTGGIFGLYNKGYQSSTTRYGGYMDQTNVSTGVWTSIPCLQHKSETGNNFAEFDWDDTYVYIARSANNHHFGDTLTYTAFCFG